MQSEKIIFSDILKSSEFNQFKLYLNKIQESIETKNINDFLDSMNRLNVANQDMISKTNKLQSLILKKYFRESDELKDIIFLKSENDSIFEISFDKYVPSYFNPKTKQYCSLNLNLGEIDFTNKKVTFYNINNAFKQPIKIQNSYLLSQKIKIDKLSYEIDEISNSLTSKINIAKYVYNQEKNINNFIKILFNKSEYEEYKNILKSRINIKKEEINILNDELNKDKKYLYEDIFLKLLKIQKHLEEILEKENFEIKDLK